MVVKRRELTTTGKLSVQCLEDSERWFGDSTAAHSLPHHALALAGEVGEFCNIVKKVDRGSLNIQDAKVRYELSMELTDVYVYVLNLAGLLGIDLEESYKIVRANNETRFMAQRAEREARNG
jgi:NTP pyrophosphatase (non-canonical NTP hydrolase)